MPQLFPHTIFDFPEDEGSLVIMTDMPKRAHVLTYLLGAFKMKHGALGGTKTISCGGQIIFSRISDKKQVLFCQKCGLRFTVPLAIVTNSDLSECPSSV